MNRFKFTDTITIVMLMLASRAFAVPGIEVLALFSGQAMLRIDGQQHLLKAGEVSPEGVKLVSATGKNAMVEFEGQQFMIEPTTIIHGELKPQSSIIVEEDKKTFEKQTNKGEVTISADINNQYLVTANINGQNVNAVIDTGANTVAMSEKQARALNIDLAASGLVGSAQTAGGVSTMRMVKLDSVSIGDIKVDGVDAAVLDGDHPDVVLLGMTFLNEVHMTQEKGVMKITQKNVTPAASAPETNSAVAIPPQN